MTTLSKKIKHILLALALATAFSAFAAEDSVLIEADSLIRQGNFSAAYQLLEPLEATRAGELNFDYLFGISAVESGNATRGAFALERVLAQDPNHKDARAEMAKAHYMLGETDASKAEFNHVLQQNPDAETRKTVEKLLTAINKLEGTTTTFGAYLDFGIGYDSNVSSAPNLSSVGVPVFGGAIFDLGSSAKEKSDNFISFAGGLSVRQPLTDNIAAFGAVSGNSKINGSETEFDNSALDFNLGLDYRLEQHTFTIAAQDNHFDLGGENFRRAYGASAQWQYSLDAFNQLGAYAQYTGLSYNGNRVRNADRQIVGVNAAHVFQGDLKPVLYGSVYGGKEDARVDAFDFLDQDIWGLRAGGQLSLNTKWQLFANMGYEARDNDAEDPAFLTKRKDDQYDATIGLRFSPARDWTIKPQINYTKNDSNIKINDFDRSIISVSVRKDFNW
jgi:tetratricopeptide (TPR) repeat protein